MTKKKNRVNNKNNNNNITGSSEIASTSTMATASTPNAILTENRFSAFSGDASINSSFQSLPGTPRDNGLDLLSQMSGHEEEAKKRVFNELAKNLGMQHRLKDPDVASKKSYDASAASMGTNSVPANSTTGSVHRKSSVSRKRGLTGAADAGDPKRIGQISSISSSKVEKVFLSGISDKIKKNGIIFQKEFDKALPNMKISQVNFTHSGSVILTPTTPADFSRLMKEDWSKQVSLGSERNNLKVTNLVRLLNKGTRTKIWRVLITLENEETQKRVLREGIFLGFTHHRCEPPHDKPRDGGFASNISQCFRCQKWDPDHSSGQCTAKRACLWCGAEHPHKECPHFQERNKGQAKCANCNEAHPAWSKTCQAFQTASQRSTKTSAARIVSSSSVSKAELDTAVELAVNIAMGKIWESLAVVISTVVSKAVLDLNEELKKKSKVDRGEMAMKATANTVKAIKDCGLLHPSRPIEVMGVQKAVWKDVFPQASFPNSYQASSAPPETISSQHSK